VTIIDAGVDEPTRTSTVDASTPVAVEDVFVVAVSFAVPAATGVTEIRYEPVVVE
jgi:hypothetical protein